MAFFRRSALGHRLVAAVVHLAASAAVAGAVAIVIFRLWFPAPFEVVAGGRSLFFLLVSIDVVLGPALTFVVASPGKPKRQFRRDLAAIVVVQLAALGYGIHTISEARPVLVSFEIDRFRVVTAADVERSQLALAIPGLRTLPWAGPRVIAAVKPTDPDEQLKSIDLGLAGIDLSMLPKNWRSYDSERSKAWARARPVALLLEHYPERRSELKNIALSASRPVESLRFLPLLSRQASWVAILSPPDVRIVGYVAVDGFF